MQLVFDIEADSLTPTEVHCIVAIDENDKALAAAPAAVAAEAVAAEAEAEVASAAPNSNMSNQEESQLGQTDGADED